MAEQSSRAGLFAVVALVAVLAGGLGAFLVADISGKKTEGRVAVYNRAVELDDTMDDPSIWGKNYPKQYNDYLKTSEMARTKYGGSEAVEILPGEKWGEGELEKRWPGHSDTRTIVSFSRLTEDPRLKKMWNGYAFAVDFREERGHAYMLEDQTMTIRQKVVKQSGNCMNCHASSYVAFMKLGAQEGKTDPQEQLMAGFAKYNKLNYFDVRDQVKHPVACIDCHDPKTMALRITRPGLINGLKALKASQGIDNYDVNKQASANEMRSYVCGQCHVEYYFDPNPEKKTLIFPWFQGLKVDAMMDYYDSIAYRDWVHKDTKAPALKVQHPEFEMWSQGIHARSGVSCADCHMPYKREGAVKISDHWVRSPVLNINRACQSCHKWSEGELIGRIEEIQDRTFALRHEAMEALMALIADIESAMKAGKSDEELYNARYMQRRAQFYLDFIEAENSMGFHAPAEAARILTQSTDYSRQGQLALRDPNFQGAIFVAKPSADPKHAGKEFETRPIPQGIKFPPAPAPAAPPPAAPPR